MGFFSPMLIFLLCLCLISYVCIYVIITVCSCCTLCLSLVNKILNLESWVRNDVCNLFVNTHVRIKIYREFYHCIIYIANEGRHIRILIKYYCQVLTTNHQSRLIYISNIDKFWLPTINPFSYIFLTLTRSDHQPFTDYF
jgi:hypothetical protein